MSAQQRPSSRRPLIACMWDLRRKPHLAVMLLWWRFTASAGLWSLLYGSRSRSPVVACAASRGSQHSSSKSGSSLHCTGLLLAGLHDLSADDAQSMLLLLCCLAAIGVVIACAAAWVMERKGD